MSRPPSNDPDLSPLMKVGGVTTHSSKGGVASLPERQSGATSHRLENGPNNEEEAEWKWDIERASLHSSK